MLATAQPLGITVDRRTLRKLRIIESTILHLSSSEKERKRGAKRRPARRR